jgi:pullulanase/glycogen debranching enzyme
MHNPRHPAGTLLAHLGPTPPQSPRTTIFESESLGAGSSHPRGATPTRRGVNFALFSAHAAARPLRQGQYRDPEVGPGAVRLYRGHPDGDRGNDDRDSARLVPNCVVVDARFQCKQLRNLRVPWDQTVLHETHERGFTMRHPAVPDHQRATFAGLAHDEVLRHTRDLGVNSPWSTASTATVSK